MASSYPTSIDAFGDSNVRPGLLPPQLAIYGGYLDELRRAVEALEAKVGVNNSEDSNSLDYKVANGDIGGSAVTRLVFPESTLYPTIKDGLDGAESGTCVYVWPGIYDEARNVIPDGVTLVGFGRDATIIRSSGDGGATGLGEDANELLLFEGTGTVIGITLDPTDTTTGKSFVIGKAFDGTNVSGPFYVTFIGCELNGDRDLGRIDNLDYGSLEIFDCTGRHYGWDGFAFGNMSSAARQVAYLYPGGAIEAGDKFLITLTNDEGTTVQTLTVSATSTTVAQTVADIVSAWNASASSLFTPITASDEGTRVKLTADTTGIFRIRSVSTTESNDAVRDNQFFGFHLVRNRFVLNNFVFIGENRGFGSNVAGFLRLEYAILCDITISNVVVISHRPSGNSSLHHFIWWQGGTAESIKSIVRAMNVQYTSNLPILDTCVNLETGPASWADDDNHLILGNVQYRNIGAGGYRFWNLGPENYDVNIQLWGCNDDTITFTDDAGDKKAALDSSYVHSPTMQGGRLAMAVPASGLHIKAHRSAIYACVTGGGSYSNTLRQPSQAGIELTLTLQTDGGGNWVVTSSIVDITDASVDADSDIDQSGNNVMTFADAGDTIILRSVPLGSGFAWRIVSNMGVALS